MLKFAGLLIAILIFIAGVKLTFFMRPDKNNTFHVHQHNLIPTLPITNPQTATKSATLNFPRQSCVLTDAKGNSTKLYTDNNQVRADFGIKLQNITNLLFTNNLLYTWDNSTQKGTITKVSGLSTNTIIVNLINTFISQLGQKNMNCKPNNFGTSTFSVPQYIQFTESGNKM